MRNSIKNTQDINDLHDKNGFKPLSSELAASARSALINGGTNLLVGIPMSVTEHMASKAIISRIEGQATMPGAEKKGADGKITTVDPAATEQQKIDARLEDSEIKTELMANQILSINEGPEAKAVSKKADASKNTAERLTNQEKTLESIEKQIEDLSKRYDIVHKPYEAEKSSDTPTDKSRMDNIAKHYTHLNKTLMRLINAVDADVKAKAQADAEPSW
ncbi:type III secretion effector protein [Pseudomonas paraveronii]|uniref:type III secretion effector protein n=1 Tax=Pseudomonas paraveronii TaxID=3040598 RepID=UPI002AB049CD|nr:type III secretion effector protein [Pseudomonas sp. V3/K/3/5]